jgi:hypothetical protein
MSSGYQAGLFNCAAPARFEIECKRSPISPVRMPLRSDDAKGAMGRAGAVDDRCNAADLPIIMQPAGAPAPGYFIAGNFVAIESATTRSLRPRGLRKLAGGRLFMGKVSFLDQRRVRANQRFTRGDVLTRPGGPGNKSSPSRMQRRGAASICRKQYGVGSLIISNG